MSIQITSNFNDILIDIKDEIHDDVTSVIPQMMQDITTGLLRTMKRRIHNNGMSTDGASIGSYSTKPMYKNPKDGAVTVSLPNAGKYGQTQFRDGTEHKTRYYSDGYKGWRNANRRKTDKVDLYFKGDLERSFSFVKMNDSFYGIGFKDKDNWNKARGMEQHFGVDIWGVGQDEQEIIDKTIALYLKKM